MEEKKQQIEVVYKKAKLGKRMYAYFIDIGLFLLSTFIFFSITNILVTNSDLVKSKQNDLVQLKNETGLFVDGINIVDYITDNEEYPSYEEKKTELSSRIDTFYQNTTYFSDLNQIKTEYNARKLAAKSGGVNLFITSGDQVIENAVNAEDLFNFYSTEISDYSLGFLVKNPNYFYLTRFSFLTSAVEFVVLLTVMFVVYFLILPLTCFKRGRQTIGMKLMKIGLISIKADNITTGKFIGRFVFNYFIFIILNFISFLIPSIVSISMMYFTKTNSNLTNYVFNDYAVDITNQQIYLNALERDESSFKLQEISIENKDLTLK